MPLWSKAKAFFKYGDRIERKVKGKSNTKNDSLVNKMLNNGGNDKSKNKQSDKQTSEIKIKSKDRVVTKSFVRDEKTVKQKDKEPNKSKQLRNSKYYSAEEIKEAALTDKYTGPTCPHCQSTATIKTAKEHTGNQYNYCYWVCPKCQDVSVTTVKGTYLPAGVLANANTRKLRAQTHKYLTHKKEEFSYNNSALNHWIADALSIDNKRAWIGQLDDTELQKLIIQSQSDLFDKKYSHIFDTQNDLNDE